MSQGTDGTAGDSAGRPWSGRHFDANAFSGDDGTASPMLADALERFASGAAPESVVVEAFRSARLLIPLVAHAGDSAEDEHGRRFDKTQELSIVTVEGPDGRNVLPVFSCVPAMAAWNPTARPVPADGGRVALAAVSEATELVVLDATSPTEFVLRRPALCAVAQGLPWLASHADPEVRDAFMASIGRELAVQSVELAAGDPTARLRGPELIVRLTLTAGLTQGELDVVLSRLAERWAADDTIATRVDSLAVQLMTG
jgi:hypothetical protein